MTRPLIRKKTYSTKLTHADYFVNRHIQSFISTCLRRFVSKGCQVGDIGCGEQPLRREIEDMGGVYTGIDIEQNSTNTVQVLANIADIPLPDHYFDILLCTEVLEHVSDTSQAFEELSRLIKPDGKILLTVPFAYPLHEEPTDFVRLTPHLIRRLADAHNLQVTVLETSGNELEVIATVWGNMFTRIPLLASNILLRRIVLPLLIAPMNALCKFAGSLCGQFLPQKFFLTILCVLCKRSNSPGMATNQGSAQHPVYLAQRAL